MAVSSGCYTANVVLSTRVLDVCIQSHRYWVFIMTTLVHFPNVCNQYFQDGPLYKEQLYEKLFVRNPQTKPAKLIIKMFHVYPIAKGLDLPAPFI